MNKKALRQHYKMLRTGLDASTIESNSLAIANRILTLPLWDFSFYHIFLSIEEQREVDTDFILHILQGKDKNVVISKSDFTTNQLSNYLLTDNTRLIKNEYNIPEPVDGIPIASDQIEVVFIPLLAFDTVGNRIGYGKGFYDRFLAKCNEKVIKVGLSFFESAPEFSFVESTDIKLDYCVTPNKTYVFE
ncbi:5-formyltetrahydrofolate cyclo-ligase [Aquimarina sp. 2-A2]|uniref:5-formyltetrahydrofolate cyclo-ligase n=1 Tax=Aquimarina sp. 2-A2 TaxID=3382644 RepID=UPI00388FB8CA